ncbi:MAG: hypothetical protein HQ547_00895 [Candidatus Omnitrophica bacterium]|nr:hypothetical protein [Candidatus Omnitrophota bacterium]
MEIKTSPKHRKCKYPLCKNILSIYNHDAYCNAHLSREFKRNNIAKVATITKD